MKKAIDKVPNIVFFIITILALTVAGIMFALYSSEKERAFNSFKRIAELEKTNTMLMNKNSDLMMQISGIEEQKKKLEKRVKKDSSGCSKSECLFGQEDMAGIASLKGYYSKEEKEGDNGDKAECHGFHILKAPQRLLEFYEQQEEDKAGNPIAYISASFSEEVKEKLDDSSKEEPINMVVYKKRMPDNDTDPCRSDLDIIEINDNQ